MMISALLQHSILLLSALVTDSHRLQPVFNMHDAPQQHMKHSAMALSVFASIIMKVNSDGLPPMQVANMAMAYTCGVVSVSRQDR